MSVSKAIKLVLCSSFLRAYFPPLLEKYLGCAHFVTCTVRIVIKYSRNLVGNFTGRSISVSKGISFPKQVKHRTDIGNVNLTKYFSVTLLMHEMIINVGASFIHLATLYGQCIKLHFLEGISDFLDMRFLPIVPMASDNDAR